MVGWAFLIKISGHPNEGDLSPSPKSLSSTAGSLQLFQGVRFVKSFQGVRCSLEKSTYFFKKQKATVAKPIDIDDFCWFELINYDLFMHELKKSNLTLLSKITTFLRDPEVDPFIKFYSYFNAVAQPNHSWTGFIYDKSFYRRWCHYDDLIFIVAL